MKTKRMHSVVIALFLASLMVTSLMMTACDDGGGDDDTSSPVDTVDDGSVPADTTGEMATGEDTANYEDTEEIAEAPSFEGVDNGDGTITDSTTGLQWEGGCSAWVDWQSAQARCEDLDLAGHDDWRLPTIDELRTLVASCPDTGSGGSCLVSATCVDESDCYPAVCYQPDCDGMGAGASGCYLDPLFATQCDEGDSAPDCESLWSATKTDGTEDKSWRVDFATATLAPVLSGSVASTRCVRTP